MAHPLSGDTVKGAAVESGLFSYFVFIYCCICSFSFCFYLYIYLCSQEERVNRNIVSKCPKLGQDIQAFLLFLNTGFWGPSAEDYLAKYQRTLRM